jgi:hypothetical protein
MARIFALLLLAGCTVGPTTTDGATPSPDATPPASRPPSSEDAGIVEQPNGSGGAQACNTDADCKDGICEGEGCGDMQGRCAPKTGRMCTRDLRTYCGCDGQTFQSSGSCPGKRFASPGECASASASPDGSTCTSGQDCASGICEGEGCGVDQPGKCMAKDRNCTMDLRQYCGCDGKTHQGSGSCPSLRFSKRGAC